MKLKVRICKSNKLLSVLDVSNDFYPENSEEVSINKFKKSDVLTINVIKYNSLDSEVILDYYITNIDETSVFKITKDGWYTLYHIVLPTKLWFDKNLLGRYSYIIYYTDGEKIYKCINDLSEEVTNIEELLEVNTLNTSISRICENHFSIIDLTQCYINTVEQLLTVDNRCSYKSDLTFKRDILWMYINIIKYSVEFGDFMGATSRLEKLNHCNGLCTYNNKTNECNCLA